MRATLPSLLVGAAVQSGAAALAGPPPTPAGYSRAVARTCAGAVLFEGSHRIGTRAGAIAVSRDIRATGTRRLHRVDAVPKPSLEAALAARWIATERRLVSTYSRAYLQIWYAIERANTSAQRARLPGVLAPLLHAPDALQAEAEQLELRLHVPDCTGGIPPSAPAGDLAHPLPPGT